MRVMLQGWSPGLVMLSEMEKGVSNDAAKFSGGTKLFVFLLNLKFCPVFAGVDVNRGLALGNGRKNEG